MESAIWGLIGTLVGAAASLFATYLTNAHTERLSLDARTQERLEKFREFQRGTLLELQAALHEVIRTVFLLHLEDSKAFGSGNAWGTAKIPDQLAEEDRIARSRVALYVERVADDSVRSTVKQLMAEIQSVITATSKAEADIMHERIAVSRKKAIEVVGKTLRETY